jgi:hypothetical protein
MASSFDIRPLLQIEGREFQHMGRAKAMPAGAKALT